MTRWMGLLALGLAGCGVLAPSEDDAGPLADTGIALDATPADAQVIRDAQPLDLGLIPDAVVQEPKRYDQAQSEAVLRQTAGCAEGVRSVYVSTPLWAEAPDEAFRTQLQAALRAALDGPLAGAFCTPGEPDDCVRPYADLISVEVDPVLDERTQGVPEWRHDGHRRFFRVWFRAGDAPRRPRWTPFLDALQVRPGQLCAVMDAVRAEVPAEMLVGRGWCTVRAAGLEDQIEACHPLARWHLDRLGLSEPAPAGASEVSVLDTQYVGSVGADEPADGQSSGETPDPDPSLAGLDGEPIDHGNAMVNLVHQASGSAYIRAVRSLNDGGLGTPASIARAFDAVLLPSVPTGLTPSARIFNFSLGWPPELEQRRQIPVEGCVLDEDPQGAPVRYLLAGARGMDSDETPLLMVAAAGNRPRLDDRARAFGAPAGLGDDPCGEAQPGQELFFPAQWARRASCGADRVPLGPLVLAVGAVDSRDAKSGLAQPEVEPLLVAPGDHVYALPEVCAEPAGVDALERLGCGRLEPEAGGRVFSGSSVATALVSGVAARADQRLRANGLRLDGQGLGRLLYALGEPLCRDPRRHRVSAGRIDQAFLRCPADAQRALVDCIARLPADAPLAAVAVSLDQCADAAVGFCAPPAGDACALPALGWPEAFSLDPCVPGPPPPEGPGAWADCAPHTSCGPTVGLEPVMAGGLGPQPKPAPCPDCRLRVLTSPEDRFKLELLLNPKLPRDTRFETPALWLSGARGIKRIGLDPYTSTRQWRSGGSVVIEGVTNPWPNDDFDTVKALLEVTVIQQTAKVADVADSVLRIED